MNRSKFWYFRLASCFDFYTIDGIGWELLPLLSNGIDQSVAVAAIQWLYSLLAGWLANVRHLWKPLRNRELLDTRVVRQTGNKAI